MGRTWTGIFRGMIRLMCDLGYDPDHMAFNGATDCAMICGPDPASTWGIKRLINITRLQRIGWYTPYTIPQKNNKNQESLDVHFFLPHYQKNPPPNKCLYITLHLRGFPCLSVNPRVQGPGWCIKLYGFKAKSFTTHQLQLCSFRPWVLSTIPWEKKSNPTNSRRRPMSSWKKNNRSISVCNENWIHLGCNLNKIVGTSDSPREAEKIFSKLSFQLECQEDVQRCRRKGSRFCYLNSSSNWHRFLNKHMFLR